MAHHQLEKGQLCINTSATDGQKHDPPPYADRSDVTFTKNIGTGNHWDTTLDATRAGKKPTHPTKGKKEIRN